jgi:hypothetical protein
MPEVPALNDSAARLREAQAAAAEEQSKADAEPKGPLEVRAAFVVYIGLDGEYVMHHDVNLPLVAERVPHWDEVKGACLSIANEIQGQQTAVNAAQQAVQGTLGGLMQIQGQMAQRIEQMKAQEALEQEKQGGNGQPAGTPAAFRKR